MRITIEDIRLKADDFLNLITVIGATKWAESKGVDFHEADTVEYYQGMLKYHFPNICKSIEKQNDYFHKYVSGALDGTLDRILSDSRLEIPVVFRSGDEKDGIVTVPAHLQQDFATKGTIIDLVSGLEMDIPGICDGLLSKFPNKYVDKELLISTAAIRRDCGAFSASIKNLYGVVIADVVIDKEAQMVHTVAGESFYLN